MSAPEPPPAGGSARREFDRRRQAREDRIRRRHPRLGGLVLAVTKDPVSTRVWDQGATGEEAVGAALDAVPDVVALHDRRMLSPNGRLSRANIDHLVITAAGVWVVDAKTHYGPLTVRGALCFVGTTLPWINEQIAGIPLVGRRDLKKLVQQPGGLDATTRTAIAAALAARFVPA